MQSLRGLERVKEQRRKKREEQETKALLCYPKAMTSTLPKRLDDTPCMKDKKSTHVIKKPTRMLAEYIEE